MASLNMGGFVAGRGFVGVGRVRRRFGPRGGWRWVVGIFGCCFRKSNWRSGGAREMMDGVLNVVGIGFMVNVYLM